MVGMHNEMLLAKKDIIKIDDLISKSLESEHKDLELVVSKIQEILANKAALETFVESVKTKISKFIKDNADVINKMESYKDDAMQLFVKDVCNAYNGVCACI